MLGFTSGLQRLLSAGRERSLSTGSPELDRLIGGIRGGFFHLFYGEEELVEALFLHLLVNALKPQSRGGGPVVVYLLCGNYRRERTEIGTEALMELVEESGFEVEEALRRIHVLTASSADQQVLLAEGLEGILEREADVCLVLARGIFKLHRDDARVRNRHVVGEMVQASIMRVAQLCASRGIPVVASARAAGPAGPLPRPESSSFLRHLANVIVYLRGRGKGSKYSRAFLLAHPSRPPGSAEYAYEVNEDLGRNTPPFRQTFHELVAKLRREFRDALLGVEHRDAFDQLVEAWSSELGAMSYAESFKLLDLLLLVAAVDNRSLIETLRMKLETLDERIKEFEDG